MLHSLEQHLRTLTGNRIVLGVTGFARAGKTVFIGALAQALLSANYWRTRRGQGPLAGFGPFECGILIDAHIRDDIDPHLPQFPFRKVRDALAGKSGTWPQPTEGESRLHIELRLRPPEGLRGWFSENISDSLFGTGRVRLEIVDYPGEWLIDLPMLGQTYTQWSEAMLVLTNSGSRRAWSNAWRETCATLPESPPADEDLAGKLAEVWLEHLQHAADEGRVYNQPGRLLRPGGMRHSPLLRLAPLPCNLHGTPLGKLMAQRFDDYCRKAIRPFYHDTFAHMERQVVLLDLLRPIAQGSEAFDELRHALRLLLQSFHTAREQSLLSWLPWLKTTHVLFAATKADHVTRGDRANLEEMLRRLIADADDTHALRSRTAHHHITALASVRATEDRATVAPPHREILHGTLPEHGEADWDPNAFPLDMPPDWPNVHFRPLPFLPLPMPDALQQGFPSIRLGHALDFLLGDRLGYR